MKTLEFGVALFVILLHASAINGHQQCYKCSTTKDWDKCDDIKKKQSCSSLFTKCLKAEIHIEGNGVYEDAYVKMCALPNTCSAKTLPKCNTKAEGVKVDCKVNCCEGDLCNTGAVTIFSGIIVLACAVLSFLNNF